MESFDELHEDRHNNEWLLLVALAFVGALAAGMFVIPEIKNIMIAKNLPEIYRKVFYGFAIIGGAGTGFIFAVKLLSMNRFM